MSKKTTVMIVTSLAVILAAVIAMALLKNQSNPPMADDKPVLTTWRDSSMMVSPFTAVRFDGNNVLVTYAGAEYQLGAINGVTTSDLVGFANNEYKDRWQKRIAEDLIAVLGEMGHPVADGHTVSVSLIDPATGQSKDVPDAEMTSENRSRIHRTLVSNTATAKQAQ